MNKIISFVLLCSLLLVCFSGCASSNVNGDDNKTDGKGNSTFDGAEDNKKPGNEDGNNKVELNDKLNGLFAKLQEDSEKIEKISFYIGSQDLHYELKNSGLYNDSRWQPSCFRISIKCNFEKAVDEDWYKQCSDTDTKSLNEAFYSSIASTLTNGEFSNIVFSPGVHLGYSSADDLYADYLAIKSLTDLEYVTTITIGYHYGLPYDYMAE